MCKSDFDIPSATLAAASLPGQDHLRRRVNSQDAAGLGRGPGHLVLAVCDGCSAGRSSELGARLGALWLVRQAPLLTADLADPQEAAQTVADGLRLYLAGLLTPLAPAGERPELVEHHLLFTFLAAVLTPARLLVFGIGDGVIGVDGLATVLDPGPENAPAYLGYALRDECPAHAVVHHAGPSAGVGLVVLGTDGAAELLADPHDSWLPAGLARNPSLLQKRLNLRYPPPAAPADDLSLAVMVREGGVR